MMRKLFLTLFLLCASAGAHAAGTNKDTLNYAEGDLANISDMLFKKGILKTDDPAAIEEYLRIHHCGLYEQYGRNDFAWARIRESQARELEMLLPSLPEGLDVSLPLTLDRYDLETNQFMIDRHDQLENSGLVTILDNKTGSITPACNGQAFASFVPRMHPLSLIVKLDMPITLQGIPMSHNAADALIQAKAHQTDERKVIMVLRLRLSGVDPLSVVTDPMRRVVLGQLDDLRVYESPARKTLLFKKDFESLRASSGKK